MVTWYQTQIQQLEETITALKHRIEQNKVFTYMIIHQLKRPTESSIAILESLEREIQQIKLSFAIKIVGETQDIRRKLSSIVGNTDYEINDASFSEYVIYQGDEVDEGCRVNKPQVPMTSKSNFEIMKLGVRPKNESNIKTQEMPPAPKFEKSTFVNFRNNSEILETRDRMRALSQTTLQFDP